MNSTALAPGYWQNPYPSADAFHHPPGPAGTVSAAALWSLPGSESPSVGAEKLVRVPAHWWGAQLTGCGGFLPWFSTVTILVSN